MERIVQSIAEEIKVIEFHIPHPKFFRCGNTFDLEVVSLLNVLYFLRLLLLNNQSLNKQRGSAILTF